MYSDMLVFVRTNLERDLLLSELAAVKTALFEPKKVLEEILKSDVRASVASVIRTKAEKEENFTNYIEGLIRELKNLVEVRVELPYEPTEGLIDMIYSWLTKNVSGSLVISVVINSSILGGATISYKGKYYDGGLSRILDSVLADEKLQILS